jgi:hypothetical protein
MAQIKKLVVRIIMVNEKVTGNSGILHVEIKSWADVTIRD